MTITMIRRSPYVFFYLEDALALDPTSLLRGALTRAPRASILALCILTGERHDLTRAEFECLSSVPADEWIEGGRFDGVTLDALASKGLLLSDREDAGAVSLRERDEALSDNAWNIYAALYHYMTQWSGVDLGEATEGDGDVAALRAAAGKTHWALHGEPPEPFAHTASQSTVRLPRATKDGELYRTLIERRTTRAFDTCRAMTLEQLDTVLLYVFACHGYTDGSTGATCIKRTSPSAGGLHPIEVYLIVSDVAGIEPGVYHYNVRDHSLGLQRQLDAAGARRLATTFMCGQSYFGEAHVSFVLTARFYRNYWKYRVHQKAYAALLMDAAHLSQTLYLVSGAIGLGAFVTLAVNSRDIEEALGLDGIHEGVLAMAGCGLRGSGTSDLEPTVHAMPSDRRAEA